jgi:peptidyl-prolyl cis-trans isomerase D
MGAQGYAVVKVNQVVTRPASTEVAAKQDRAQYAQWWTAAESQAYYGLLKERFKANITVPRPARAGS